MWDDLRTKLIDIFIASFSSVRLTLTNIQPTLTVIRNRRATESTVEVDFEILIDGLQYITTYCNDNNASIPTMLSDPAGLLTNMTIANFNKLEDQAIFVQGSVYNISNSYFTHTKQLLK